MGARPFPAYGRFMKRCKTCGAQVEDPGDQFCGGDRCATVFLNTPIGAIGYTGSYREAAIDIVSESVASVLESRGPD